MMVTAAVPRLVMLLDGDGPRVRSAAAEALGQLGDKDAAEPLVAALQDTSDSVRTAAVIALGRLGADSAIPPLRELLLRRNMPGSLHELDNALMLTLLKLGDAESLALSEQRLTEFRSGSFGMVEEICRQMIRFGDVGVGLAVNLLQNAEASSVRRCAAQALTDVDSPGAKAALRTWRRMND